jgi:F0F1-type ATP synthase assembly protein I
MTTPRKKSPWAQISDYASLGIALPATTVTGYFIGVLMDHWLGTNFLYLVFLIIGIAAGFLELYRIATRKLR